MLSGYGPIGHAPHEGKPNMDFASILTISLNFEKIDRENEEFSNSGTFVPKIDRLLLPKVLVKTSESGPAIGTFCGALEAKRDARPY